MGRSLAAKECGFEVAFRLCRREVVDRAVNAATMQARISELQRFLLNQLDATRDNRRLRVAIEEMIATMTELPIDQLADRLGLGRRQPESVFGDQVGMVQID